jgi:hypothetical protein
VIDIEDVDVVSKFDNFFNSSGTSFNSGGTGRGGGGVGRGGATNSYSGRGGHSGGGG